VWLLSECPCLGTDLVGTGHLGMVWGVREPAPDTRSSFTKSVSGSEFCGGGAVGSLTCA